MYASSNDVIRNIQTTLIDVIVYAHKLSAYYELMSMAWLVCVQLTAL